MIFSSTDHLILGDPIGDSVVLVSSGQWIILSQESTVHDHEGMVKVEYLYMSVL